MTGTSEFWKAVRNHKPQKAIVIEYRAYYKGTRIVSMISNPKDGDWPPGDSIVISKKLYREIRYDRYRVIDGKLVEVQPHDVSKLQLELAKDGKYTSLKNNIIFAAEKGDNYKQKEYDVKISSTRKL